MTIATCEARSSHQNQRLFWTRHQHHAPHAAAAPDNTIVMTPTTR